MHLEHFAAGTPRVEIARLRHAHRLLWQQDGYARGGHWLVFQRADIDFVFKNPGRFTNAFGPLVEDTPDEILPELQQSMTFQDPPSHRVLRSLGDLAFKADSLAARRPLMESMTREILDALGDRRECELIEEVAMQLPMRILFRLLGVRDEDYGRVVELTNTLTLANDPDFAENRAAGFQASIDLIAFGEALAADLRAHPRDSLFSGTYVAARRRHGPMMLIHRMTRSSSSSSRRRASIDRAESTSTGESRPRCSPAFCATRASCRKRTI